MRGVIITICILLIVIGVAAYLNKSNVLQKQELAINAQILFKESGQEIAKLDFSSIKAVGETQFVKVMNGGGKSSEHSFTGVALKLIFQKLGINLEGKSTVVVSAIDGYSVALTLKEVLDEENVYIIYQRDGEFMKGKEDGGAGPYQLVIRKDAFAQRWCKFVAEVDVR